MIVLINIISVVPGRECEFLKLWDRTNAVLSDRSGYLSATLHRADDDRHVRTSTTHTHVNVAHWASEEDYVAAVADDRLTGLAADHRAVCAMQATLHTIVRDDRDGEAVNDELDQEISR